MKFSDWLEENEIEIQRFAYENNVSQRAVQMWKSNQVKPLKVYQQMIHKISKGKVSYKDWEHAEQTRVDNSKRSNGNNGMHKAKHLPAHEVEKS